ncbi:MAG TPA: DNA polymerase I [Gaiellales bacterium]|nr:DNA polymerase I [Gaiellales bacterium]
MATAKQTKPSDLDLDDAPARTCDVFLIDGNGLAYRAFHALPEELQTAEGQPTNALLGMANMLMKMLADYRPATVLVAWDERPTKRLELDPEYKAHRKPTPPLLQAQRPYFAPLVEAFGYRNIRVEGMEADDVIGTLSARAEADGRRVCVVSTDRDAFQLASDSVCIMMTPRGVSDVVVYTPDRIRQRYGIGPAQIPDFIGLKGDSSDNIKGVPGIGEKTAADLLVQFDTLEGIYHHLDEVAGEKRRESLRDNHEEAVKSKRLATIDRTLDIDVDFSALLAEQPDRSTMKELFRKLEFRALLKRVDELEEVIPAAPGAPLERTDMAWREGTVDEIAGLPYELAVSISDDRAAVASEARDVLVVPASDRPALAAALEGHRVITHGEHLPGLLPGGDTQIAAYLLDPGRSGYEIADLAEEQGVAPAVQADPETAELVAAAGTQLAIHAGLAERIDAREMTSLYTEIELPLVPVLAEMERCGVQVDSYRLAEIAAKLRDQVDELEQQAYELAGGPFTIGSPKQLGEVLFERLELPADRKGKTGYSTDARVLAKIRHLHPIVDVVESWREQSKLLSTYLDPLPGLVGEDGRLHTYFSQTTAATGRLSSIRPNLQNIPIRTPLGREIRGAFIASPGFRIVSADYSQVELRILAHLSGEPALREAFARGEDIHRATAAEVLGKPAEELTSTERNRAKAVNFGIIYGISSFGLSEQLSIPRDEAQAYIDAYLARFPRVNEFMRGVIDRAKEDGYVTTLFGRRRPIPELRASNYQTRSLGERLAVNTVMQGSAADIIKVAMIGCHRRMREQGMRSMLVLQVHDELVFEAAEDEMPVLQPLIREEMVSAYPLDPPLEVDIGQGATWLDAK